jgi:high-affinity Fe2+/Pb2+ permease
MLGRHFELCYLKALGFVTCVIGAVLLVLAGGKLEARQPTTSTMIVALGVVFAGVTSNIAANTLIPAPPTSQIY